MANMINAYVDSDDILYHLGDWAFGGKHRIKDFRDMINCKNIHLIYGNHDHKIASEEEYQKLFNSTGQYSELYYAKGSPPIILFHYPIGSWNGVGTGTIQLHGHCHGNYSRTIGKQMDVGVDTNKEMRPYNLTEILDLMKEISVEIVDHHDSKTSMR